MNAYTSYLEKNVKKDYISLLFKSLRIKETYKITKPERYFTYYLILQELLEFDQESTIKEIKERILQGDTIHKIFIEVVKKDTTSILAYHRSVILYYEEEDFNGMFFV